MPSAESWPVLSPSRRKPMGKLAPKMSLLNQEALDLAANHGAPVLQKVAAEARALDETPVLVQVAALKLDGRVQPREKINRDTIAEYREVFRTAREDGRDLAR